MCYSESNPGNPAPPPAGWLVAWVGWFVGTGSNLRSTHYYRTGLLSRLGKAFYPGFPTGTAKAGQISPFVPGQGTETNEGLCSRLVTPTGTKGSASADVAGTLFGPGWYYQPGPKAPIFSVSFFCFFWVISIPFQLNFVLEFKRSMNCSNININIYSFTHIKCNTKVNYIQSATKILLNFVIFTPIIYV